MHFVRHVDQKQAFNSDREKYFGVFDEPVN